MARQSCVSSILCLEDLEDLLDIVVAGGSRVSSKTWIPGFRHAREGISFAVLRVMVFTSGLLGR